MTKKFFTLLALCALLSTGFGAEFKVESLVAKSAADLKHAPALIAKAAIKHPKAVVEITTATVTAFPDQATAIVEALLLALPEQYEDIVQSAILAQPKLAVQITAMAVATLPDQADDIMKVAEAAAPADLRKAVAAAASPAAGSAPTPSSFPVQPIRPDAVSPSH